MLYKKFGKRTLDIFIVFSAMIILSPLMLLTAILIKIFDPGAVIFKQNRIGMDGCSFFFYKFRSMPVNTGDIASDKVGAVQLTWIGRVIRRTNIDELPQLLNILKGDMSIVGPRPPIGNQNELIQLRTENGALKLRPGLTGLAQVNAFDGMTVAKKAEFDGKYSENISFFKDINIILNTVLYLFRPPPVY